MKMHRLEREDFLRSRFIWLWALMGFQAGFINSFGFLACGRYVSHVTGFGTQIGLASGRGEWGLALEMLGAPLSFIFGSFLSSCITVVKLDRGEQPRFDLITLFIPISILLLAGFGELGYFGQFGTAEPENMHFMLLFFLSLGCGMQNGCFATLTKGQIRTTHMTGIATDLGTDLARSWFGKLDSSEARLVKRTNITRISTFISFAAGAILSVSVTEDLEYLSLLIPVVSSGMAYFYVLLLKFSFQKVSQQKLA